LHNCIIGPKPHKKNTKHYQLQEKNNSHKALSYCAAAELQALLAGRGFDWKMPKALNQFRRGHCPRLSNAYHVARVVD